MEGRGRMVSEGEKMRALLLRKGKKEVDRREERGGKGFAGPMSKCFLRPCYSPPTAACRCNRLDFEQELRICRFSVSSHRIKESRASAALAVCR